MMRDLLLFAFGAGFAAWLVFSCRKSWVEGMIHRPYCPFEVRKHHSPILYHLLIMSYLPLGLVAMIVALNGLLGIAGAYR